MKRLLTILLVLSSVISFSQSVVPRAGASNTVSDARLQAQYNLFIPRVLDTTAALTPPARGLDTCGAIIYSYADDAFWYRACYPFKHWARVGAGSSLPRLPDGLYSGGDVAWTGTGLTFSVTPAIYVLNGTPYAFNGGNITLPAADPTFDKIVVIILDSSGASYVDGIPSATPQEPSINPQTQIRRAIVTVPANSPIPAIVTQILYDENLGTPTEWDATSTGTVVFGNTNFPFHLTIAAAASGFVAGQYIGLNYTDTVNSLARGNLVAFLRLAGVMQPSQNFNVNLLYQGNIVGQTLNFTMGGMSNGLLNSYQALVFPMTSFSPGNLIFDEVRFTAVGTGTFPAFNLDYIQFQQGIIPVTIIPDQRFGVLGADNFATQNRDFNFNNNEFRFTNIGKEVHTLTSISDTAVVFRRLTSDMLRLDAINNLVFVNSLLGGNPADPTFKILSQTSYVENGHDLQFDNAGYITAYQYPLFLRKKWPAINSNIELNAGLILDNDTIAAQGLDSSLYHPLSIRFTSTVTNVSNQKLFIDGRGAIHSVFFPSGSGYSTDSIAVIRNGYISVASVGSFAGVTSVATNNGSGITGGTITSTGTIAADTSILATRLYANNLVTTYYNFNLASGFRIAHPFTNGLSTLAAGYALAWDSVTSNTLTIRIDTTLMATRAWVGGSGTPGTVSTVTGVNTNGFSFSIANPTTTPAITLSTTVTGIVKGNGTAFSGATVGTDYSVGTSALATGILKSTTATGALSIAIANTDYITPSVTTLSSLTTIGTIISGGLGTGSVIGRPTMTLGSDANFDMYYRSGGILTRLANGITGQVLTATTGAAPSWQAVAATLTINSSLINSGTSGRILFQNASNQVSQNANLFWDNTNSRLGIGTTFPTALLTLAAGTATVPPLRNVAGTNTTTPLSGAHEFDGTNFYLTPASAVRKRIVLSNNATPGNGQIPIGNGTDYTVANITAGDNGTVITNGAGTISVRSNSTPQTLTTGATITWNVANSENAILVLANTGATLNITNPVAGHTYVLRITQGTGGSRTITTWPAGTVWPNGTIITLGTAVGAKNLLSFYWDGTNYYAAYNTNIYQ